MAAFGDNLYKEVLTKKWLNLAVFIGFFLYFALPAQAMDFTTLRYLIKSRSAEPKVFIPESVLVDEDFDIKVYAPGAQDVVLFASEGCAGNGSVSFKDIELNLASDYEELGRRSAENGEDLDASFSLRFPLKEVGKRYCFEAVVSYESSSGKEFRPASYYGSGGYFTNSNAVEIIPETKKKTAAASFVKSMIPGLNNARQ